MKRYKHSAKVNYKDILITTGYWIGIILCILVLIASWSGFLWSE